MGVQHGHIPLAEKESAHMMRAPDDGQERKADTVTLSSELTLRHCGFSRLSELCRHSAHAARHHVTGLSVEVLSLHSTLSVVLLKIILFWCVVCGG